MQQPLIPVIVPIYNVVKFCEEVFGEPEGTEITGDRGHLR